MIQELKYRLKPVKFSFQEAVFPQWRFPRGYKKGSICLILTLLPTGLYMCWNVTQQLFLRGQIYPIHFWWNQGCIGVCQLWPGKKQDPGRATEKWLNQQTQIHTTQHKTSYIIFSTFFFSNQCLSFFINILSPSAIYLLCDVERPRMTKTKVHLYCRQELKSL